MRGWLLVFGVLAGLSACAQPQPQAPAPTQAEVRPHDSAFVGAHARPLKDDPASPDRSCSTSADCVVKNVGNCCGYYPGCVNTQAKVDPDAVHAQCGQRHMMGVCGFPVIRGCACVKGQCVADTRAGAQ